MIELNKISKSYIRGENKRDVLKNLSLDLSKGERIAVVGPSGSGKTTLLNLCGAMDHPDSGDVLFNGKSLPWNNERQLADYRNKHIGFVFQEHSLLNTLTAFENILVPALVKGNSTKEDRDRAYYLLNELGLRDRSDSFPEELSGGENQRIAVARALINKPRLLLCDEPTGSLDEENSLVLMRLLLNTSQKNNTSIILVSHSARISSMLDRVYFLKKGNLIVDSSI